jgi:hypothetical protein
MFLANSRYFNVETVETEDRAGRKVTAVKLRRLPYVAGTATVVHGHDRLDVMALRKYSDSTQFWHIADANTELQANDLVKPRLSDKEERVINVPDK